MKTKTSIIHPALRRPSNPQPAPSRPPHRPLVTVLLSTALMAMLPGCETMRTPETAGFYGAEISTGRLAPGDVVRISFPGAPELNVVQKIPADGKLSLPLIGRVTASGRSVSEMQTTLSDLYRKQLTNQEVVIAVESSAIPVYVSGAVNSPGKVLLERPMTVLEAIMEAGGFTSGLANPKRVVLVRHIGGSHSTLTLDLSPALRGKQSRATEVHPYDVIYVHERTL